MVIAALGSELQLPDAIYKFIVFMLLIKVGLSGGIAILGCRSQSETGNEEAHTIAYYGLKSLDNSTMPR
jgi:hypothetical protein